MIGQPPLAGKLTQHQAAATAPQTRPRPKRTSRGKGVAGSMDLAPAPEYRESCKTPPRGNWALAWVQPNSPTPESSSSDPAWTRWRTPSPDFIYTTRTIRHDSLPSSTSLPGHIVPQFVFGADSVPEMEANFTLVPPCSIGAESGAIAAMATGEREEADGVAVVVDSEVPSQLVEFAQLESAQEQAEEPELGKASRGSFGHPDECAKPCKYHWKKRGCKDGSECARCHLCVWKPGAARRLSDASTNSEATTQDVVCS